MVAGCGCNGLGVAKLAEDEVQVATLVVSWLMLACAGGWVSGLVGSRNDVRIAELLET